MSEVILNAEPRATGKKAAKAVRNSGMINGVYYSTGSAAIPIAVHPLAMRPIVYTADAKIVRLNINNQSYDCVLKDISFDPVTDKIVHFDLFGVDANAPIEVEVTVLLQGLSIGVRDGGVLEHILHKIKVSCLPKDLPEHIEVDVSNLTIGHSIHLDEISIPNVKIIGKSDMVVATIAAPRSEEVVEPEGEEAPALVGQKGKKLE
ncbi:MAG: 50S ribosomal protein L25 [Bacteroidetes bacterium]|nr:50S ribosomal protein L25 [Bacteroidota bacterium]